MNLENILITGSSGLVGAPLVTKLLSKSKLIIGLDPVINAEFNENYKHISIPLNSVEDFTNLLEKYDITKIIHTGGISGPMLANENPNIIIENNIFFTLYLTEAARIYKKLIDLSSALLFQHMESLQKVIQQKIIDLLQKIYMGQQRLRVISY